MIRVPQLSTPEITSIWDEWIFVRYRKVWGQDVLPKERIRPGRDTWNKDNETLSEGRNDLWIGCPFTTSTSSFPPVILGFTLGPCGKKYFFYRLWAWNKVDRKQELGSFLSLGNVGRPDHRSLGEGPGPHYSSQSQDQTMEARETCTLEEGAAPKGRLPGAECTDPIPAPNLCWPGLSKQSTVTFRNATSTRVGGLFFPSTPLLSNTETTL